MKKHFPAVCITATLLVFISCQWFRSGKASAHHLYGDWRLDTAYQTGQPSDSIGRLLATVLAPLPGERDTYRFNKDSSYLRLSSKDSIPGHYYLSDSALYLGQGSNFERYPLQWKSDSSISFVNNDSVEFVLKKLP